MNKGCIRGIINDQRAVLQRPVNIALQLLLGQRCACRIIGEAQIQHIHIMRRHDGRKAVLRSAGQIFNLRPQAIFIFACAARHGIGIDVHRIDRIHHRYARFACHQFLQPRCIGLGAVRNKHFVLRQMNPARLIEIFDDSVNQKIVTEIRAVSAEALHRTHFKRCFGHGLACRFRQRTRHIANAQTQYMLPAILLFIRSNALRNFPEQIPGRHRRKIRIERRHEFFSPP